MTLAKTDDDSERQRVHTLAHAIVFTASIPSFSNSGAAYIYPFLLELPSNGPAHQSQAGPSCDEPPTRANLKVMVGARQATGNTAGAASSAEAGAEATKVLDDGERAPPGRSAEAGAAAAN